MIYNTRNRSTTESHRKKKKPVLMLILKGVYSWNKMWSLESLAMLKWESRTSLHAVQTFCSYALWDSKPGFVLSWFVNFLSKSRLLF